ncbi:adenosylcobinamide-GDP ribazoletransferase [soil metagenome]
MRAFLHREWEAFLTGIMFFTRVRVPARIGHDAEMLNHAARHFPLVGLVVGTWGAFCTGVAGLLFPPPVAVLLGMFATLWMTGAFHEDGLADMVDAFGGGYTRASTLEIMKDSRLGTFGTVALFLVLGLKWSCLSSLTDPLLLLGGICAAHGWSRAVSISLVESLEYARDDADSKSKPLATKLGRSGLLWALLCGVAPLVILVCLSRLPALFLVVPLTLAVRQFLSWRFRVRLGGYTGDCLGATQQISEGICYLTFLAVWRFAA